MSRMPIPFCQVLIEEVKSTPAEQRQIFRERERGITTSHIQETTPFLLLDTRRFDYTCDLEYATADGETEATMSMSISNVERSIFENVGTGSILKVKAGYMNSDSDHHAPRIIFYGKLVHIISSITGGERTFQLTGTMNPSHLGVATKRRTYKGRVNAATVLDDMARSARVSIEYPRVFNLIRLEDYTIETSDFVAEVRKIVKEAEGRRMVKPGVDVREAFRNPEGNVDTGRFHLRHDFTRPFAYEVYPAPTDTIGAFRLEVISDHVTSAGVQLSSAEPEEGADAEEAASVLQQRTIEDLEGEQIHLEYNVESIFDPERKLGDIMLIYEGGKNFGTLAGITSLRHAMGNIERRGTAWTTSYTGPLADPVRNELIVRTGAKS